MNLFVVGRSSTKASSLNDDKTQCCKPAPNGRKRKNWSPKFYVMSFVYTCRDFCPL